MTEQSERQDSVPNDWVDIDGVVEVIKQSREKTWLWSMNSRCKYISLRIDMRDGHCIIRDRHGNIINLEDLQNQAGYFK